MQNYTFVISKEINKNAENIKAVINLLKEGSTVPFIARYRKEATGNLDEVEITYIRDRLKKLEELDARRETVLKTIDEQGKLTEELKNKIETAATMTELEDIYLPYKPKKRTRASIAKEKGLEGLADIIMSFKDVQLYLEAEKYLSNDVKSIDEALSGARDIVSERINETSEIRKALRMLFLEKGNIQSKLVKSKEKDAQKYKDYFDYKERASRAAAHRLLAVIRGNNEGLLKISLKPEEAEAVKLITRLFIKSGKINKEIIAQLNLSIEDSYKRLLSPSIENEVFKVFKEKADIESIKVFTGNLKELLLAAPLGTKAVLAMDPGIRTGSKLVCLDSNGQFLEKAVVFIDRNPDESAEKIKSLVDKYSIHAIAVGNGTGGKELQSFLKKINLPENCVIAMINENGASIYSASESARKEFPDLDLVYRGAISIGRRLQDPLSELIKIDPKSIGVGQYQHDVNQSELKKALDDVVVSCVNSVGVDLNLAGPELLSYVSGMTKSSAKKIFAYRNKNGAFKNRNSLLKVPGFGEKTFEQAAGFLRINNGSNILDKSAIHPESYFIVENIAKDIGSGIEKLFSNLDLLDKVKPEKYTNKDFGLYTVKDILQEIRKPGRDPRKSFEAFSFDENINTIEDLTEGMVLPGTVTNVTNFGAFVDIGVHTNGLVHKSHIADTFVENPADFVKAGENVKVRVLEIDIERKRIALSLKSD